MSSKGNGPEADGHPMAGAHGGSGTESTIGADTAAQTLRRFYDSASVLMGTVELDGDDIIHVSDNNASAAFFGTTPEAMRGRSARELGVPEPYVRMWFDAYQRSLTSDGPVRFDYEHAGKGCRSDLITPLEGSFCPFPPEAFRGSRYEPDFCQRQLSLNPSSCVSL